MSSIGPDLPAAGSLTSPSRMQASSFSQDTASQPFAALLDATTSAPPSPPAPATPSPPAPSPSPPAAAPSQPASLTQAAQQQPGASERFNRKFRHDRHRPPTRPQARRIRQLKSACRRQRRREPTIPPKRGALVAMRSRPSLPRTASNRPPPRPAARTRTRKRLQTQRRPPTQARSRLPSTTLRAITAQTRLRLQTQRMPRQPPSDRPQRRQDRRRRPTVRQPLPLPQRHVAAAAAMRKTQSPATTSASPAPAGKKTAE